MSAHEEVQPLLALSAAGLLEPAEERAVREHVRECSACAAHLESLGALAAGLGALAPPEPAPDLLLRTQARIAFELAVRGERRRSAVVAAGAGVIAWIMNLATWALCHFLWPEWSGLTVWLLFSTVTALIAAPAAAAIAASRRRAERSFL